MEFWVKLEQRAAGERLGGGWPPEGSDAKFINGKEKVMAQVRSLWCS
jgi:hypothetical protein